MKHFGILNSRKRAIIALVHTVVFLAVAALQLALSHAKAFSLHGDAVRDGLVLLGIYTVVTTVLLGLLCNARCVAEKLYFSLCAISALFGLLRILLGDPVLHANVIRVALLLGAVVTGAWILREHSTSLSETAKIGTVNAAAKGWIFVRFRGTV